MGAMVTLSETESGVAIKDLNDPPNGEGKPPH